MRGRRWLSLAVTLWSLLGLLAAVVLGGFTLVDTAVAGDLGLSMDSDTSHPRVDRVRYSLAALTYLHGDQVLTGPHRSLPLTLGWLGLTALVMFTLWRRWASVPARRALRASLFFLALTVGVGGPVLLLAQESHNWRLQQTARLTTPVSMVSASPLTLHLWGSGGWVNSTDRPGCQDRWTSTFPNPTLWAVVGVLFTAGAGLWRSSDAQR